MKRVMQLQEETPWDEVIRELKLSVRRALYMLQPSELVDMTKQSMKLVSLGYLAQLHKEGECEVRFDLARNGAFDFVIRNCKLHCFVVVTVHFESISRTFSDEAYGYNDLSMTHQELLNLNCHDSFDSLACSVSYILEARQALAAEACRTLLAEESIGFNDYDWAYHTTILCVGRRVESTGVKRVRPQ